MKIIATRKLRDFWVRYPDTEQALKAWHDESKSAVWQSPGDIKAAYGHASFVKNNRVVFNIKGNKYRLVIAVSYRYQSIYIKFIGTHKQYDAIDAATVSME